MKSPQKYDADDLLPELKALEREGLSTTEALISILQDTSKIPSDDNSRDFKRIKAAHHLRISKDPRSIHALINVLGDHNESISLVASSALVAIGPEAVAPLISALLSSTAAQFRFFAIETLAQIKDNRAVEALISLLQDSNSGIFSASALGEIGDSRAVVPLINAIHSLEPGNCRPYVVALGKIGDSRALQPLLERLEYFPEWVRPSAVEAIEKIRLKTSRV